MAISAMGNSTQRMNYPDPVADQKEKKIEKYEQTLNQLKQNLQRTEKDAEMPDDEKTQKMQEIQDKIEEINRKKQLAELEEEQKKEERLQKEAERQESLNPAKIQMEDPEGTTTANQKMEKRQEREREDGVETQSLTAAQIEAAVIGDTAVKQARKQQNIVQDLENRIRVLGGEIQVDQNRGNDTTVKETERNDLERRANQARESTGRRLGSEQRRAEERKEVEEQQKTNVRFIQSQKDTALPNFQISI
ncbi:MAG: hypothetical protein K2K70_12360 [Lachnospiraceae bacterium]|nr:hypothetical protein [Lachnospiraceae bacterium]